MIPDIWAFVENTSLESLRSVRVDREAAVARGHDLVVAHANAGVSSRRLRPSQLFLLPPGSDP